MERLKVFRKRPWSQFSTIVGFAFVLSFGASKVFALTDQQHFSTPEQAVQSLLESIRANNFEAMLGLFGEKYKEQLLFSGDAVQDKNNRQQFASAAMLKQRIEKQGENRAIFIVGNEDFVFPIPLVKENNNWRFDTESGIDEILNRRIGRNELSTINVLKAYNEAQFEYASKDRDNDDVLEYAQKIRSSPDQHDGLFWEADASGESSPLGPLFAAARAETYFAANTDIPQPYHGYYYKLLTKQGCGAVGGQYDYVINGNMIAGFGMIAFPAKYGSSGIMSFIVNHQGKIFEKNLGAKTAILVKNIKEFTPVGWTVIDH